jgi:prevent-host-death family protein
MRKWVSIVEARRELGRLADEVRRTGQSVALTRRGRVVARITPEGARPARGVRDFGDALGPLKGSVRIMGGAKELEREIRTIRREFAEALDARIRAFPGRLKGT